MFEEDIPEPWVRCDSCLEWVHQTCALYNQFHDMSLSYLATSAMGRKVKDASPFCCPLCRLGDKEASQLPPPWLHNARESFFNHTTFDEDDPDDQDDNDENEDKYHSEPKLQKSGHRNDSDNQLESQGADHAEKITSQRQHKVSSTTSGGVSFAQPLFETGSRETTKPSQVSFDWKGADSTDEDEKMESATATCSSLADTTSCDESLDGELSEASDSSMRSDSKHKEPLADMIRWDAPSLPTTKMTDFIEVFRLLVHFLFFV